MNILFIGDIFGKTGIKAIKNELPNLKTQYNIDLVIANCENTTNCRGLNVDDYNELTSLGIDYMTMGNHTWDQSDYALVLEKENIVRPDNIVGKSSLAYIGTGTKEIIFKGRKIIITNLMGKSAHCRHCETTNAFVRMEEICKTIEDGAIHIVDFHCESTSEKNCFQRSFKGKASLIVSTHTHIQTNDANIEDGTAYISDVGMTGPSNGVIGANPETLIQMFFGISPRFRLTEATGPYQLNAVFVKIADDSNKALHIENIFIREKSI
ncbi:MAG: TIGR00282 family metallophosphoesterase [Mycoplasma sp.]